MSTDGHHKNQETDWKPTTDWEVSSKKRAADLLKIKQADFRSLGFCLLDSCRHLLPLYSQIC